MRITKIANVNREMPVQHNKSEVKAAKTNTSNKKKPKSSRARDYYSSILKKSLISNVMEVKCNDILKYNKYRVVHVFVMDDDKLPNHKLKTKFPNADNEYVDDEDDVGDDGRRWNITVSCLW